jgi:isochorismate synthase
MFLNYRVPGKEIKSIKGQFHPLTLEEPLEGFVLASSDGKNRYVFKDDPTPAFNFYKNQEPHLSSEIEFTDAVSKITTEITETKLLKVVLSRVIKCVIDVNERINYFYRLCQSYPEAFVYYFEDENLGSWVGASPEILLSKNKDHYAMMSLAGTRTIHENRDWTLKEKDEQSLVTNFILDKLNQLEINDPILKGPFIHEAGPVEHLRTDITLKNQQIQEAELIKAIHPTPAVCGIPPELAKAIYQKYEKHEREFYTGYIGVFTKEEAHAYVNLRCGKLIDNNIFVFVGAGITLNSDPKSEWIETQNKSKTLLDLL